MPPRQQHQPDPEYIDEHHQRISEFANDYFDDDDEREEFVGTLMERRGYVRRQTTSWDPPEPEPPNGRQGGRGGATPGSGGRQRPAYFKR
jgi:hypothetical protein